MTDINTHALRLIRFVDQSVTDALSDDESCGALLSEADSAVRVLQAVLKREAPTQHTQMMISGALDVRFQQIAVEHPDEPCEALRDALKEFLTASRFIFGRE